MTKLATSPVFRSYVPAKPLCEFVAFFWYAEGHDVKDINRTLPAKSGNGPKEAD
jgi:hypothetical protein